MKTLRKDERADRSIVASTVYCVLSSTHGTFLQVVYSRLDGTSTGTGKGREDSGIRLIHHFGASFLVL